MSYFLKLVRTNKITCFKEEYPQPEADHYQVTPLLSKSGQAAVGLQIEIVPVDQEREGVVVRIPKDGESIYVTTAGGENLDAYHWPPHPKRVGRKDSVKQVFRVTESSERERQLAGRENKIKQVFQPAGERR